MTSANVFHWNPVNQGQTAQTNAAGGRSKTDGSNVASVFASLMSGSYAAAGTNTQTSVNLETAQTSKGGNNLDRYSYRENRIEPAQNTTIRDKIAGAAKNLDSFQKDVVQKVAEDLSVDEQDVTKAMETLGMSAFDLLVPQNLAQVVTEITGEESPADLLMNAEFTNLMQDMDQMGAQLVQLLDVEPDQLSELVAQMDVLEDPVELTGDEAKELAEAIMPDAQQPAADVQAAEPVEHPDTTAEVQTAQQPTTQKVQQPEETTEDVLPEEEAAAPEQNVQQPENAREFSDGEQSKESFGGDSRQAKSAAARGTDEPAAQTDIAFHATEIAVEDVNLSEPENASYLSVDTMDLIEQIAENVRVSVSEGTTSMEMQLNPENLGKVYLQISAKEGVVNANITASNEAVRAALETQIADLRQSLNQAGVKVDAIEVTVASHEFEKNLEQNAGGEEQQGERQQEQTSQRRNIRLSSLDELSGVMTEEEALVAQIMRDNGNSVDLTA